VLAVAVVSGGPSHILADRPASWSADRRPVSDSTRCERQRDDKGRAPAGRRLRLCRPAVRLSDRGDDRQAQSDASAAAGARAVDAIESLEHPRRLFSRRGSVESVHGAVSVGHPPVVSIVPSGRTSRALRPRASSQRGASAARTMAAVAATFALRHVGAATLTVRQHACADAPERGSTIWCISTSPARQRRTVVLEVARPPACTATT
jgi:hypothetical protein